ncbi:MAG: FadR/GntR family transcriptional regulator [Desulfonatronovibrionaceae bacterium]
MENRANLLNQLGNIVVQLGLGPGDRLPAERQLARLMHISRNTLRNFLRTLEGRGLVHTRRGSGTYLRARIIESTEGVFDIRSEADSPIASQLEAAFLFLPLVMERSLFQINDRQLQKVQECNIALGQSIYSEDLKSTLTEIFNFFRLISLATNNCFLIKTTEQLCFIDPQPFNKLHTVDRKIREQIFAGHVDILQALRETNALGIKKITEDYILTWCGILEKHARISMPPFLSGKMKKTEA